MERMKPIRKERLLVLLSQLSIFLENMSEKVFNKYFYNFISDVLAGMFIFFISLSNLVLFLNEKVTKSFL